MRFVPIKTEEQLDLQAVHRLRESCWVMRRTAVINQIRRPSAGTWADAAQSDVSHVDDALPGILADFPLEVLWVYFVSCWAQLKVELDQLTTRIEEMDMVIRQMAKENEGLPEADIDPGNRPGDGDRAGGSDWQRC